MEATNRSIYTNFNASLVEVENKVAEFETHLPIALKIFSGLSSLVSSSHINPRLANNKEIKIFYDNLKAASDKIEYSYLDDAIETLNLTSSFDTDKELIQNAINYKKNILNQFEDYRTRVIDIYKKINHSDPSTIFVLHHAKTIIEKEISHLEEFQALQNAASETVLNQNENRINLRLLNANLASEIVKLDGSYLLELSDEFKNDESIILDALIQNPDVISNVSNYNKNDPLFLANFFRLSKKASLDKIDDPELLKNPRVIFAAVSTNSSNLAFVKGSYNDILQKIKLLEEMPKFSDEKYVEKAKKILVQDPTLLKYVKYPHEYDLTQEFVNKYDQLIDFVKSLRSDWKDHISNQHIHQPNRPIKKAI